MSNTITRKSAIETAMTYLPETETEVHAVLTKMVEQLSKERTTSPEAAIKRKAATAAARADLVAKVAPVLRKYLTTPKTAKELFAEAQAELPTDFTAPKVQNILIREMAPELVKVETKGKANTYQIRAD